MATASFSPFSRSFWSAKTIAFTIIFVLLITVKFFYSYLLWDSEPVKVISVKALFEILHGSEELRSQYQVIDVREKDELKDLSIDNVGVINLPLSEKNSWRFKISALNPTLPTICFCARGRRSVFAARYLGKLSQLTLSL